MRAPAAARLVAAGLSSPAGKARPSGLRAGQDSWRLGVSPRPLITSPFSVSAVCLVRLFWRHAIRRYPWLSSRLWRSPRPRADAVARIDRVDALSGEVSMPSLGARADRSGERWQCLSPPARPPGRRPCPDPTLVTKKLILACCACAAPKKRGKQPAARQYELPSCDNLPSLARPDAASFEEANTGNMSYSGRAKAFRVTNF